MDLTWIQVLTTIGSILIPTIGGFAWMIHRMDAKFDKIDAKIEKMDLRINNIENKLTALDMRIGFIEKLLEMIGVPLKVAQQKERRDP